ncbi:MAG: sigma-70 family RNA polymerase sigma factor [Polyangiaceae bacterium]
MTVSASTAGAGLSLPLSSADDAELVRAVRAREREAALIVWDRYSAVVRGVLRRSLGPGHDVEDLVQEVFLGFFRNAGDIENPSALRSFLVSIATRAAISEIRKRKVRSFLRLTDSGVLPDRAGPEDEGREALRQLYRLLDSCSASDRMAFVLRHIEGLPLEAVAQALDVSLATVKRKLAHVNERIVALAKRDPLLSEYVVSEAMSP